MIAGEDAEAARVDRQRAVQREFGGEIGDRSPGELRVMSREPGPLLLREELKAPDNPVVALEEDRIRRLLREPVGIDLSQELHRVVAGAFPQPMVDAMKEFAGVELPAPPQVLGDVGKHPDALRKVMCLRGGRRCRRGGRRNGRHRCVISNEGDCKAPVRAATFSQRGASNIVS